MAGKARVGKELDALKALVTVYGPREAARLAGIPYGTMASYAFKYSWKKHAFKQPKSIHEDAVTGKDAGDVMAEALERHRSDSTLNLARYVDKAARKAAEHGDPLEVARKVRDVAGVHQIIFPQEEDGGLIEGALLIGTEKPTINHAEIEAAKATTVETIDVRAELQDNRPGGD